MIQSLIRPISLTLPDALVIDRIIFLPLFTMNTESLPQILMPSAVCIHPHPNPLPSREREIATKHSSVLFIHRSLLTGHFLAIPSFSISS